MPVLDYAPAILAFIFAMLGIFTKTKDDSKTGLGRVTKAGWFFLLLSAVSFALGAYTIRAKHIALEKRSIVAGIARDRIADGVALLVRPFCASDPAFETTGIDGLFLTISSGENLEALGRKRTVSVNGMGERVVSGATNLPYSEFEELYQLFDFYVLSGKEIISSTLDSFGGYLSEDEIISVSSLLSDPFLNDDYILRGKIGYFELGLSDEAESGGTSPWNTVGLHYFDAIYEGNSARAGDLVPAREFLLRARAAIELLVSKGPEMEFNPCVR